MRIALALLAALAVVLPTALIPRHGNVYSLLQVERAFKAEGLPLHLTSQDSTRSRYPFGPVTDRSFDFGSRGHQLAVVVYEPTLKHDVRVEWAGEPCVTKTASVGNVLAFWPCYAVVEADEAPKIRAALTHLAALLPRGGPVPLVRGHS